MHSRSFVLGIFLVGCLFRSPGQRLRGAEPSPQVILFERLLPIIQSPNPLSCVPCHLAGVDLKENHLNDHEKTFRSLKDQGRIDLDKPENSKILRLIPRGERTKKRGDSFT